MRKSETGSIPHARIALPPGVARSSAPDPATGMVRLIGFVLGGAVEIVEEEGDACLLRRGALTRKAGSALVAHAVRQGILARNGCRLEPLAPARPLLKRLLSGGDAAHLSQHALIETVERVVEGEKRCVTINRQESVLGALALMKDKAGNRWFAEDAVEAGERLARDFTFAGLQPRVTASWQPRLSTRAAGGSGAQAELSEHQIDARDRVNRALAQLGPELSGVALDVCCFGKGLEQVERERQWPARSAKLMLRTALDLLARHYKL